MATDDPAALVADLPEEMDAGWRGGPSSLEQIRQRYLAGLPAEIARLADVIEQGRSAVAALQARHDQLAAELAVLSGEAPPPAAAAGPAGGGRCQFCGGTYARLRSHQRKGSACDPARARPPADASGDAPASADVPGDAADASGDAPFQCSECDFGSDAVRSIESHARREHQRRASREERTPAAPVPR